MSTHQSLHWQAFKEQLQARPDHDLRFQYAEGLWVDASYHITEIKQAPITSVDCGGKMDSWTEIIVQLWEPSEKKQDRPMKAGKALSIIDVVEKALPLNPEGIVKIEFGNSQFDTRQLTPGRITAEGEDLLVELLPGITQCKATGRGRRCGTDSLNAEPTMTVEKPKIALETLVTPTACCSSVQGGCE